MTAWLLSKKQGAVTENEMGQIGGGCQTTASGDLANSVQVTPFIKSCPRGGIHSCKDLIINQEQTNTGDKWWSRSVRRASQLVPAEESEERAKAGSVEGRGHKTPATRLRVSGTPRAYGPFPTSPSCLPVGRPRPCRVEVVPSLAPPPPLKNGRHLGGRLGRLPPEQPCPGGR